MNRTMQPMHPLAWWQGSTLHDVTTLGSMVEYEASRRQCLRAGDEYKSLDYIMDVLIDNDGLNADDAGRQVVFDAAYVPVRPVLGSTRRFEMRYRHTVLALAAERVILRHIHESQIKLATVTGGENTTAAGDTYMMYPALHLIVDYDVPIKTIYDMLSDVYDYMTQHGYIIRGPVSDIALDIIYE